MIRKKINLLVCVFIISLTSCSKNYTPKPQGYLRIEPPEPDYLMLETPGMPFSFLISDIAFLETVRGDNMNLWFNIDNPSFNATIYCSYNKITPETLPVHEDECRKLINKTIKKADAVSEHIFVNDEKKVYGTMFIIEGESASPVQFMLTDSISNFFRAALYYNCNPNADSLAPVTDYLMRDISKIIESFYWK